MKITCPLCKESDTTLVTSELRFGHTADVRRCGNCTLVFIDQASFKFPENFYETEYHQTYLTHIDPDMLDPQMHYSKMQSASQMWIQRVRNLLKSDETVLDVGCSTGHLLVGIRDSVKNVFGHELSRKEVAFCRNSLGLDVADTPLQQRFSPSSLDVITLIFVLEHIGDPLPFLRELKRYLKPDGRLVIVVPNVQDPLLSFYRIPKFSEFYYCIEHLFYYSPHTLRAMLEEAGFVGEPEAVQEYPITNHLNWAYRERPSETLSARRGVPDVVLHNKNLEPSWEALWHQIDQHYRSFMTNAGFSDRVWCVARRKS